MAVNNDYNSKMPSILATAVNPGPLSAAHAFLENKCESCHTPNRGIDTSKCIACHTSSPELLMQPATTFHAQLTDCRGCHSEHQGKNVRPIHMNHEVLLKIATNYTSKDFYKDSTRYHTASLNCQSCHIYQDKHKEFFGKECASCHSTKTWKIPGYLHPSPTSTNCAECHKAPPSHFMMHFEMVDRFVTHEEHARVDQCYLCHKTDSFNDIKGVGFYKMH